MRNLPEIFHEGEKNGGTVKQLISLSVILFLGVYFVSGQEVIENPEKPLNKKAGRVLKLKEELRITDKNGDFYFRAPDNLKIASDGSIFIADSYGNNFLKFSSDGKFLKNLYRRGEGPGEIQDYFDFALSKEKIYVYDYVKRKLIEMTDKGDLVAETRFEKEPFNDLFGFFGDRLVFLNRISAPHEDRTTSRLYDDQYVIILLSTDGETRRESHVFPNQRFYVASSLGGGAMPWSPFDAVLDQDSGYLYVSCNREYMIHVLDLNENRVIRSFNRKYKRVDYEMLEREEEFVKKYNAPRKKYKVDIERLFLNRGLLWVVTSTKDANKSLPIDVFDEKGKYVDNFFIDVKGGLIAVHNGSVFVVDTDENENYVIIKYRISGTAEE